LDGDGVRCPPNGEGSHAGLTLGGERVTRPPLLGGVAVAVAAIPQVVHCQPSSGHGVDRASRNGAVSSSPDPLFLRFASIKSLHVGEECERVCVCVHVLIVRTTPIRPRRRSFRPKETGTSSPVGVGVLSERDGGLDCSTRDCGRSRIAAECGRADTTAAAAASVVSACVTREPHRSRGSETQASVSPLST
jgi:hypothetical protein